MSAKPGSVLLIGVWVAACSAAGGNAANRGSTIAASETISIRLPPLAEVGIVPPTWSVDFAPLPMNDGTDWWPHNLVAVAASDSQVIVLDASNSEAALLRMADGAGIRAFGGAGQGEGEYLAPRAVAAVEGGFAIADPMNERIAFVDEAGVLRRTMGFPAAIGLAADTSSLYALTAASTVLAIRAAPMPLPPVDSLPIGTMVPTRSLSGLAVLPQGVLALVVSRAGLALYDPARVPRSRVVMLDSLPTSFAIRALAWQPASDRLLVAAGPLVLCLDVSTGVLISTIRSPALGDKNRRAVRALSATQNDLVVLEAGRPRLWRAPRQC